MGWQFSRVRLRKLRAAKELSRRSMAEAAGIHPNTVTDIESGKSGDPGSNKLGALATVLGCEPNDLFIWRGAKPVR